MPRRMRPSRWRRPHRLAGLKPTTTTRPSGTSTRSTSRRVRCGSRRQLERMRQHHQVEAVAGERQRVEVAVQHDRARRRGRVADAGFDAVGRPRRRRRARRRLGTEPAVRHAVGAQRIEFGQAELQRVEAEHVGDGASSWRCSQASRYCPGGVSSQRVKPIIDRSSVMNLVALPAFDDNRHPDAARAPRGAVVDPAEASPRDTVARRASASSWRGDSSDAPAWRRRSSPRPRPWKTHLR